MSCFALSVALLGAGEVARGQSAVWQPQGATTGSIFYNGGNVGIGTTTPGGLLSLNGSFAYGQYFYNAGTLKTIFGQAINAGDWSPGSVGGDFALRSQGGNMLFTTDSGLTTQLYLKNGGFVGIGTTNPQYKLAVNGVIGAKDVIVTNAGWPDYVFKPEYRLRPLREVAAFIQTQGHLPEIPAANEVEAGGVSVGQMQAKLLEKIEELTLHMIQAEERNARLEEVNRGLREEMTALRATVSRLAERDER